MKTNFTYEQFEEAAKKNNLLGQFSQADLNLARRNPDAGMEILNYKTDYGNATTDEQRALARSGAESVRKKYGGYSGGEDGSGFYMTGSTPTTGSFTYTSEDVLQKARDGGVYDQLSPEDIQLIQSSPDFGMGIVSGKMEAAKGNTEYGRSMAEKSRILGGGYTTNPDGTGYYKAMPSPDDFTYKEAPKYTSQYGDTIENLKADILNREEFSYDAENDPLYGQYKKQYTREGRRVTEDTMGAAAAMTGGIPSSYAATAAAQAGNYYAAQLTDKIPQLHEAAYNKYINEHNMKLSTLDAVKELDESDYSRYRDDVGDWNAGRNFDYGKYLDEITHQQDAENTKYTRDFNERAYKDGRDDVLFTNNIALRELDNAEKNTAWDHDYAEKQLGQNMKNDNFEQLLQIAILQAEAGNTELLNRLGQQLDGENWKALDASAFQNTGGNGNRDGGGGSAGAVVDETKDITPTFSYTGDTYIAYPSGYINGEDWDALVERYGEEQLLAAGATKGEAPYKTREEAVQYLKDNGKSDVAHHISTRAEWEKHKGGYISYEKYLEAKVSELMKQ